MQDEGSIATIQGERDTDQSEPVRVCSRTWFMKHWKKVLVLVLLLAGVTYVVMDLVLQTCIQTEASSETKFRIACDSKWGPVGSNASDPFAMGFDCVTSKDSSWTPYPSSPQLATSCQKPGACVTNAINDFLAWIANNVTAGFFVFAGAYIVACVLFVPGSILTIGAGIAFGGSLGLELGLFVAVLSVWVGAYAGACLAFLLGRFLLRDMVAQMITRFNILSAIDIAIDQKGFLTVLLLRLSPIIPFNAFNYVMGATRVSFRDYAVATAIGMLPGTIAYVFIGVAIGTASAGADSKGGGRSCTADNTIKYVLTGVGAGATLIAVILISRYAKKEFDKLTGRTGNKIQDLSDNLSEADHSPP